MKNKDAIADRLLKCAEKYIESIGGKAVVIGGIEIQHFPGEDLKFKVAINCVGRRPVATPPPQDARRRE